jgi:hypothetical protein
VVKLPHPALLQPHCGGLWVEANGRSQLEVRKTDLKEAVHRLTSDTEKVSKIRNAECTPSLSYLLDDTYISGWVTAITARQ